MVFKVDRIIYDDMLERSVVFFEVGWTKNDGFGGTIQSTFVCLHTLNGEQLGWFLSTK